MLEINIKSYLKITHIFSSVMWQLPREIFNLAIESLNKVKRPKQQQKKGDCREESIYMRN